MYLNTVDITNVSIIVLCENTYSIVTGAMARPHIKGPSLVSVYYILCGFYDDIKEVDGKS